MLDRKGILSYLFITFGITYGIEIGLILAGFRVTKLPALYGQLAIASVMWVPALATVITIKFITREGFGITNLRIGSWKPYIASAVIVPICSIIIYGLTWLLGFGQPDWDLVQFKALVSASGGSAASMPAPGVLLSVLFVSSLLVGPTLNGLFGFGEELGWRGYLLPKLMPLGKFRAYSILGIIWGLWHAPLVAVGFNYPGHPVLGILGMIALTTALGIFINELSLHYRSTILAGWIHGVLNGQAYGLWRVLFPEVDPLLGGMAGLVGITVWLLLGIWVVRRNADKLSKNKGLNLEVA